MGGISDKPANNNHHVAQRQPISTPITKPTTLPLLEKDAVAKARFLEAMKKRDIILFKKTLETYNVKPTDLVGLPEQQKTVLHKLAEYNFSEAMEFVLSALPCQNFELVSKIVNMKDCDGNTPALLCCLSNSVETLEVLAKHNLVDMDAKNNAKKTVLEISMEMESPCINVLTSIATASTTKSTLRSLSRGNSQNIPSLEETGPKSSRESLDYTALGRSSPNTSFGEKKPQFGFPSQQLQQREKEVKDLSHLFHHTDLQSKYPQVLANLEAKKTNFQDSEFPHEIGYLEPELEESELLKKYPDVKWKRPVEFMGPAYQSATVFNTFKLANISQSPLIGSEFYSALAIMAEFPQRLSRVFQTQEISKNGLYALNFLVAGISLDILLDDYFPCLSNNQPLYSRPVNNELWFLLLEKAFAKLYGGFQELENVSILEALEVMSGMPVSQYSLANTNEDRLWRRLMDYDKKNFILCAGEKKSEKNRNINRIFNIVCLNEIDGCRLVKIRNHFEHFKWDGDFSANSSVWSKALREQVGYSSSDKSCFFMSFKDFLAEFQNVTVCHYQDHWFRSKLNVVSEPNHFVYFEVNVEKDAEAYISIHQKQPEFAEEGPEYDVSPVEVLMAREVDGNHFDNIAFGEPCAFLGKPTTYVFEGLASNLKPGKYFLCVKVKWVDERKHSFYLNMLSSTSLRVTQLNSSEAPKNIFERVYLSLGVLSPDKFYMGHECEFVSGWAGSHLWLCAFNRGNKTWTLDVVLEKLNNLKIAKRCKSKPSTISFILQPNQKASAYLKRTSAEEASIKWRLEQAWE